MRPSFLQSLATGLAVTLLTIAAASAAVPSLERLGQPAPAETVVVGVQLASACGNWQPRATNDSQACRARQTSGTSPQWIRQGDRGSQDHNSYESFSLQQSKKEVPDG